MIGKFIAYSVLVFLTAFLGGLIPLLVKKASENLLKLFVSLGAGLLLGMALLHMVPEASELIPESFGFWFLAGFVLLLILERFAMVHACEEEGCDYHSVGTAAFVGLTVHGIIEGLALASSIIATTLAPIVLLAILIHKAPAAFALTSILKLADKTNRQIVFFIIGIALSSPIGMAVAYTLFRTESAPSTVGILLALSAGTFLYISACDLVPELHRTDKEKFKRLTAFILGIGIIFLCE